MPIDLQQWTTCMYHIVAAKGDQKGAGIACEEGGRGVG